jgi:2-oxoglutarate dehydrogenase complex dehydrogenase (E1) component-like enzyme
VSWSLEHLRSDKVLWTLDEVVQMLKTSYCGTIGWEFNHILNKVCTI